MRYDYAHPLLQLGCSTNRATGTCLPAVTAVSAHHVVQGAPVRLHLILVGWSLLMGAIIDVPTINEGTSLLPACVPSQLMNDGKTSLSLAAILLAL